MPADLIVFPEFQKFRKAIKDLDKDLSSELTKNLKTAGKVVAEAVKDEARAKALDKPGLSGRGTGDLVKKIVPQAKMDEVVLKEKANRDGFPYPAIYEFGGAELRGTHGQYRAVRSRTTQGANLKSFGTSLAAGYGPRAFMYPGVVKSIDKFQEQMLLAMEQAATKAGWK